MPKFLNSIILTPKLWIDERLVIVNNRADQDLVVNGSVCFLIKEYWKNRAR